MSDAPPEVRVSAAVQADAEEPQHAGHRRGRGDGLGGAPQDLCVGHAMKLAVRHDRNGHGGRLADRAA